MNQVDAKRRVDTLAKKLGATIEYVLPNFDDASSWPGPRRMVMPEWTGDNTDQMFWTSLHELGHIARQHGVDASPFVNFFGPDPELPEQEAEAWAWALDHAGVPLNEIGRALIAYSIGTYVHNFYRFGMTYQVGPALARIAKIVGAGPFDLHGITFGQDTSKPQWKPSNAFNAWARAARRAAGSSLADAA